MRKGLLFTFGIILLIVAEILRVYFIMPFPGSQHNNTINVAYFLNNNIFWIRIVLLLLMAYPFFYFLRRGKIWQKIIVLIPVLFYAFIFYMFNFQFLADKMFYQPTNKHLVNTTSNKVDTNQLVIGIVLNGQAKAYPVEIIGYHHQVQDTVGGEPVIVTYCTVCRTGAVFSPLINNTFQHFRLVGMDHFNAMFEDENTKSWWRQVNGEAITGPLKGSFLKEFPSSQMRLSAWIRNYPQTLILQPDSIYQKEYDDLKGYDSGTVKSSLEKRDSNSWKFKSWVVGITTRKFAKAYDWNDVVKEKIINDTIADIPVLIALEKDGYSFHAWKRNVNGQTLQFVFNDSLNVIQDINTHSSWNWMGICTDGALKNSELTPVQSYQEFWHSWSTFHPNTTKYNSTK
ncbi:MAG: DUF3179 domain-containing protein [Bacteroidetes bacterium]|nr:DUF3179 domain-containing protein [Bacteroidota bacterium]